MLLVFRSVCRCEVLQKTRLYRRVDAGNESAAIFYGAVEECSFRHNVIEPVVDRRLQETSAHLQVLRPLFVIRKFEVILKSRFFKYDLQKLIFFV